MKIGFQVPLNPVSFGQVSLSLLREAMKMGIEPFICPLGKVDLSSNKVEEELQLYINKGIARGAMFYERDIPCIKLWHLFDNPLNCPSKKMVFFSFYELDAPTDVELHVAKQIPVVFSSKYTVDVFKQAGADAHFVPLGFDYVSFFETGKKYFHDDRVVFNLAGKFENRKHHQKIIKAWLSKFGNDSRYYLNCAVYNPHFNPEMNENLFRACLEGKQYYNIIFHKWMPNNAVYNDYLNSGHVVIGMSGGEGWGLPEFQSVCLGKHAVIMNAHSYASWADDKTTVLVNPSQEKVSSIDGFFFKDDRPFNQGNIFTFDDEEFIAGCEKAVERYRTSPINMEGRGLKDKFSYKNTLEKLLELIT